jgi:retinol dehydrogenase-14
VTTLTMEGKGCLVTGATSGIGKATALGLASRGASVWLVAREPSRGEATRDEIRHLSGNPHVEVLYADLAKQADVRALAARVLHTCPRLDVLINNAGAMFSQWELTVDGIERTFAINHLAPFLLTTLLLERLRESAPARIITISSDLHAFGRLDTSDPQGARTKDILGAYSRSKLANVMFTLELARQLEGSGVTANCLHPGMVASGLSRHTTGVMAWLARLLAATPLQRTSTEGAANSLLLASAPTLAGESGLYFAKGKSRRPSRQARDPEACKRLWQASLALVEPKEADGA